MATGITGRTNVAYSRPGITISLRVNLPFKVKSDGSVTVQTVITVTGQAGGFSGNISFYDENDTLLKTFNANTTSASLSGCENATYVIVQAIAGGVPEGFTHYGGYTTYTIFSGGMVTYDTSGNPVQ